MAAELPDPWLAGVVGREPRRAADDDEDDDEPLGNGNRLMAPLLLDDADADADDDADNDDAEPTLLQLGTGLGSIRLLTGVLCATAATAASTATAVMVVSICRGVVTPPPPIGLLPLLLPALPEALAASATASAAVRAAANSDGDGDVDDEVSVSCSNWSSHSGRPSSTRAAMPTVVATDGSSGVIVLPLCICAAVETGGVRRINKQVLEQLSSSCVVVLCVKRGILVAAASTENACETPRESHAKTIEPVYEGLIKETSTSVMCVAV